MAGTSGPPDLHPLAILNNPEHGGLQKMRHFFHKGFEMKRFAIYLIFGCVVLSVLVAIKLEAADTAPAAAPAAKEPENPAHDELRALRKGMVEAIQKGDIDKLLTYLDPDVVVTWQNGEVSRKPEGVKAYYDRMMKGPNRVVQSIAIDPTVDELTHLYGDTGVAFGSSKDDFKLADGKDLNLLTRWTATVVKKEGTWKVAAFHASVDMFDNAVLRLAIARTAWWAGGIAAIVGLIAGFVIARAFRKGRAASGAAPAR